MNSGHPIADEVLDMAIIAIAKGENWMAYNQSMYLIDKEDVFFFSKKADAIEFARNNIAPEDNFNVIYVDSIQDILKRIPYGLELSNKMNFNLHSDPDSQLSELNSQSKKNIMNNENLQYLADNVKYMGFGENSRADLEKNLNSGKAEFQLHLKSEMNNKPFEATLNFRKSETSDLYFFNNYHASLNRGNGEKVEQTFYLNKGKGVTAKEAFNLLDGRAVHKELTPKEGQPYKAWIQLDTNVINEKGNYELKQFHENYGYNLKEAVSKFAIKELNDPEKEKSLLQSLQKGNLQSITIEKDGNTSKMFIEADPQFKKVNLYDASLKPVVRESLEQYLFAKQAVANDVRQETGNDKKKEVEQKTSMMKEKKEKKTDSLLPKKKEINKKGLSL